MHTKKHSIQVRDKATKTVLSTVKRKIWMESIGNFCPVLCTYKGKRTLVNSEEGDVSDPFRRTDEYANSFFIEV